MVESGRLENNQSSCKNIRPWSVVVESAPFCVRGIVHVRWGYPWSVMSWSVSCTSSRERPEFLYMDSLGMISSSILRQRAGGHLVWFELLHTWSYRFEWSVWARNGYESAAEYLHLLAWANETGQLINCLIVSNRFGESQTITASQMLDGKG